MQEMDLQGLLSNVSDLFIRGRVDIPMIQSRCYWNLT